MAYDTTGLDVVTGAFGYSGAAITRRLLDRGRRVRTLTNRPAPPGPTVETRPLDFADRAGLQDALAGATTLYNTYWVRFAHGQADHARAVANSEALFTAAARAGVQRIVHVSITHPSAASPYSYFRGKAQVEAALAASGVSRAVLRPAILFGGDGVLLNNIAWLLRRLPVFGIGGRGDYRIRPIHLDDLADLAVEAGATRTDTVIDAVGPDRPTFVELVGAIRRAVGSRALVVHVPPAVLPVVARGVGVVLRDVLLTGDEFRAMADGLADTDGEATAPTSVLAWIAEHAGELGRQYANELDRHYRR